MEWLTNSSTKEDFIQHCQSTVTKDHELALTGSTKRSKTQQGSLRFYRGAAPQDSLKWLYNNFFRVRKFTVNYEDRRRSHRERCYTNKAHRTLHQNLQNKTENKYNLRRRRLWGEWCIAQTLYHWGKLGGRVFYRYGRIITTLPNM
jgi:hypothetical protein